MTDKILFVDDEPLVLDGYKRMLHSEFDVSTAQGGEQGLASVGDNGPYAVVISDMRMPGMSGAEFLAHLRQKAPETVRMLLTGYTGLDAAMSAVNEGNIFRYLTKPCDKQVLIAAINIGIIQYHTVRVERELIKTFYGQFKQAYESRNDALVMSYISNSWQAGDGTSLSDLQKNLRQTFRVFDEIRYNMGTPSINRLSEGLYQVAYDLTIIS